MDSLTKEMIDQSIETLAYTIDAKDRYTRGHSMRVAKYSCKLAKTMGKSDEECEKIYRAALLHDIGKIAIPNSIINKPCKLSDEEFEKMKNHTIIGAKILEKMKHLPYLQDAAKYHHERYDGTGYPFGLKGDEIPELARIISVADYYDAMTSFRSYRPPMDQPDVKQEVWKRMGTQFDPHIAKVMISIIDSDEEYDMHEKFGEDDDINFEAIPHETVWPAWKPKNIKDVQFKGVDIRTLGAYTRTEGSWFKPNDNIEIDEGITEISFHGRATEESKYIWNSPTVITYSSDDGKVAGPGYEELSVLLSAGYGWRAGSSKSAHTHFTKTDKFGSWENWFEKNKSGVDYEVFVGRTENEIKVQIYSDLFMSETLIVLPRDYNKKVYIAITGELCDISNVNISKRK